MATTPPRPPRRPVAGSRNPTARPRKLAGARGEPTLGEGVEEPLEERVEEPLEEPVEEPVQVDGPFRGETDDDPGAPQRSTGPLGSLRTTLVLVVTLILLVGVAAGESWYLWLRDEPVVSATRPVVTGEMAHRSAVETASQDIEQILSTSYQSYDDQVDQATSTMTDTFAQQYRQTAEQIRDDFVAARTEVRSQVVAAGVMRASSEQVEALLFVNQAVSKKGKSTAVSQYRVRMTMVHTDQGWLVSDISTS